MSRKREGFSATDVLGILSIWLWASLFLSLFCFQLLLISLAFLWFNRKIRFPNCFKKKMILSFSGSTWHEWSQHSLFEELVTQVLRLTPTHACTKDYFAPVSARAWPSWHPFLLLFTGYDLTSMVRNWLLSNWSREYDESRKYIIYVLKSQLKLIKEVEVVSLINLLLWSEKVWSTIQMTSEVNWVCGCKGRNLHTRTMILFLSDKRNY